MIELPRDIIPGQQYIATSQVEDTAHAAEIMSYNKLDLSRFECVHNIKQ